MERRPVKTIDVQGGEREALEVVGYRLAKAKQLSLMPAGKADEPLMTVAQQPAPSLVQLSAARVGRVYLAGPMTGYENYNFAAFNAEADRLRAQGFHVENPADHGLVDGADWADYLRYDISRLASCERIHLLPGWSKSKGANLEVRIALSLGMPVYYADDTEPAGGHSPVSGLVEALEAMIAWANCSPGTYPGGYPGTKAAAALAAYKDNVCK